MSYKWTDEKPFTKPPKDGKGIREHSPTNTRDYYLWRYDAHSPVYPVRIYYTYDWLVLFPWNRPQALYILSNMRGQWSSTPIPLPEEPR